MDLKIKEKTAFISGSTAGIGFATARSLLKEGVKVIINGRSAKGIETALAKLQQEFEAEQVSGIAADLGKPEEVERLFTELPAIDVLINNVGIYTSTSFFDMKDEDWYRQFDVNVMSAVRLSRHYLPGMLERNWGRILFISSECATLVPADLIAYSMTKTALLAISRGLAQLTKGTAVTVNTVAPGSTLSEGAEQFLADAAAKEGKSVEAVEAAFFAEVRTSSLLQRFATVDEVASTITYLSSPLAAATNGATIKVDGGSMGGII